MINLVDAAKMEGKPKKKWMKKAFANSEHEHDSGKTGKQARLAEVGMASHKHKGHSRVKAMYGKKEGKYYGSRT